MNFRSVSIIIILAVTVLILAIVFYPRIGKVPVRNSEPLVATSSLINKSTSTTMILTSSSFMPGESIPKKFTCDGGDFNPELLIQNVPEGTESMALIVDDPDVSPAGALAKEGAKPFTHWTVWGIDPKTSLIKEESIPPYSEEGETGFERTGYGGPCPPPGKSHRYFFHLYALDTKLSLASGANRIELEQAMSGHVLETAELMGTYQR